MQHGRLLIVEDEPNIANPLAASLRFRGYEVATAGTGRDALSATERMAPDLILLDVMLPDIDGFTLIEHLRANGTRVPVIFLTARDSPRDRVTGLVIGGDDYVTKPFGLEEVAARIQAVLRRTGHASTGVLRVADLELDQSAYRVQRGGVEITLSPTEWELLRYLMLNAGQVLRRQQILDRVWPRGFVGDDTVIATYISYLRRKIDQLGEPLIHTQRGVGYCIREP